MRNLPYARKVKVLVPLLVIAIIAVTAKIYWPEPEPPIVFAIKGIVYLPQGGSSVLIGAEIYHEGDAVKGTSWTVMKIFPYSVKLQNPDGEEKKITMEGR